MNLLEFMIEGQNVVNDSSEEIIEKKPKYTVFDYINQINNKSKTLPYIKGCCSGYMLTLHYSHDINTLKYSEKFNKVLYLVDDELAYTYFIILFLKEEDLLNGLKNQKKKTNLKK